MVSISADYLRCLCHVPQLFCHCFFYGYSAIDRPLGASHVLSVRPNGPWDIIKFSKV